MKKLLEFLSGIPTFNGLVEDQLKEIRQIVVDRYFTKGELVFSEGDHGEGFYVVATGMVKIFKVSLEGKEHIMRIVAPGEAFAQASVYAGRAFPASAQAIAKSHLLFFPRAEFVRLTAEQKKDREIVSLKISKVLLSNLLGTTPETLSRILSQMADSGLIEVIKRDIRILDHAGLKELAEHGKNISG